MRIVLPCLAHVGSENNRRLWAIRMRAKRSKACSRVWRRAVAMRRLLFAIASLIPSMQLDEKSFTMARVSPMKRLTEFFMLRDETMKEASVEPKRKSSWLRFMVSDFEGCLMIYLGLDVHTKPISICALSKTR